MLVCQFRHSPGSTDAYFTAPRRPFVSRKQCRERWHVKCFTDVMLDSESQNFDQGGNVAMYYQIIAESDVHPGRRLLRGTNGDGYIQLEFDTEPIAVPERDFDRLRAMHHYRSVSSDGAYDQLASMGGQEQAAY